MTDSLIARVKRRFGLLYRNTYTKSYTNMTYVRKSRHSTKSVKFARSPLARAAIERNKQLSIKVNFLLVYVVAPSLPHTSSHSCFLNPKRNVHNILFQNSKCGYSRKNAPNDLKKSNLRKLNSIFP